MRGKCEFMLPYENVECFASVKEEYSDTLHTYHCLLKLEFDPSPEYETDYVSARLKEVAAELDLIEKRMGDSNTCRCMESYRL